MLNLNSTGSLVWAAVIFLVVVTTGGATILLRQPDDKRLVHLSLLACLIALVFAPLLRVIPDQVSFLFFLAGVWPILAIIAFQSLPV